jgi:hypothetical protein
MRAKTKRKTRFGIENEPERMILRKCANGIDGKALSLQVWVEFRRNIGTIIVDNGQQLKASRTRRMPHEIGIMVCDMITDGERLCQISEKWKGHEVTPAGFCMLAQKKLALFLNLTRSIFAERSHQIA